MTLDQIERSSYSYPISADYIEPYIYILLGSAQRYPPRLRVPNALPHSTSSVFRARHLPPRCCSRSKSRPQPVEWRRPCASCGVWKGCSLSPLQLAGCGHSGWGPGVGLKAPENQKVSVDYRERQCDTSEGFGY
jgi:hypothetical protein